MQPDALLILRLIFTGLFIAVLLGGVWILRNQHQLFGVDPEIPSENSSSRSYNKMQVLVVWLHALLLTGAFALGLK
jgi:hypothetical protein